jgi:hypothetical protein
MLPQRTPRLSAETQAEIVRLSIRQVSQTQIAKRTEVHRQTVKRVLQRTQAALAINQDLERERLEAIAVYREIQRTAWEAVDGAIDQGRSPVAALAEVRQTQQRIDALLGLAPLGPEDLAADLARFKRIVRDVIAQEAPELGPRIAQRLLAASDDAAKDAP